MQIRNLLAQPRLTDAWNAQRATDPAKGLRNMAALLHHLGDLATIFTNWESHPVPKHHCLVGVPEHHWAREDVALLSPEPYGETASFPDNQWMARRGQGVVQPHRARVAPSKLTCLRLAAPSAHSTSGNQVLGRSSNSSYQKAKAINCAEIWEAR